VRFDGPAEAEVESTLPARREAGMRRMRITPDLLRKYGYTEGCEGCRYKRAGLSEKRGHSERCRNRINDVVDADEEEKYMRECEAARLRCRDDKDELQQENERGEAESPMETDKHGKAQKGTWASNWAMSTWVPC